ncbi:MAG: xanthine dehydrogenase family protein molybdopterin-binding subunit [Myxococcota bacterium]|nr:xanthine dehydrogenase family protein molybdopterin-binding subunit [Myxococcota bacterium]
MTKPGHSFVGHSVNRVDGHAKVSGRAIYVDDISMPGMLHGRTVRSKVAHGTLKDIVFDAAFDWSDITTVTAKDITGPNFVALMEEDQPALVPMGGKIMHHDEPVALICGPDKSKVDAAMAHIDQQVDELPAVLSIDESRAANTLLYGDDNIFKAYTLEKGEGLDEAFAAADHIVEGEYFTGAQEQMYIETQGMIAHWQDESLHITGSMQCPYYIHNAMKSLFGLEDEAVVISQAVTGGGFGGKEEYPSMLAAHVALLAKKAGAPVKIIYDRSEDVAATTKRHPCLVKHRLGLNAHGEIVAADVDITFDGGAYVTLSPVVLSRGVLHSIGPYKCPTLRVVGRMMATNTPPHGAYRGFGAPQTTFAYERQIDKAARVLGMDPVEFRLRNRLNLGDETATGQILKNSVASEKVVREVMAQAEKEPPNDICMPKAVQDVKRGRGFALYYHGAGFTGSGEDRLKGRVAVAVNKQGEFEVRSASTDIGQGAFTIFTQIAATTLGVDVANVKVVQPNTKMVPDSGPTVASRTCMVVGGIVEQAANGLKEKLQAYGESKGLDCGDVLALAEAHAKDVGELAFETTYKSPPGIHFDDQTYRGDAYPCYGWAACLVDVAVDPDTYEVTVERCIHAVDVGKAVHPIIVKGQIEGGTMQALGWALWESVLYKNGKVMNPSMTDCIIPTAMEAPELETIIVEEPYPHGPHGAKGVGEIPMDGPAAAVANALQDALGKSFDVVPMLPETIAEVLKGGPA